MTDKERKAVPREPTEEMIGDGRAAWLKFNKWAEINSQETSVVAVFKAMYDAAPVLATAPAEPPKDGEAARLIERLREWTKVPDPAFKRWNTALDDMIEAADALARLSAPVPDKEK